jgi:hypothetical protein
MKFKSLSPRIVLPATIAFLIWSRPALAQDSLPKPAGNHSGTRPRMNQKLSPDDCDFSLWPYKSSSEKIELMHGNGMDKNTGQCAGAEITEIHGRLPQDADEPPKRFEACAEELHLYAGWVIARFAAGCDGPSQMVIVQKPEFR